MIVSSAYPSKPSGLSLDARNKTLTTFFPAGIAFILFIITLSRSVPPVTHSGLSDENNYLKHLLDLFHLLLQSAASYASELCRYTANPGNEDNKQKP